MNREKHKCQTGAIFHHSVVYPFHTNMLCKLKSKPEGMSCEIESVGETHRLPGLVASEDPEAEPCVLPPQENVLLLEVWNCEIKSATLMSALIPAASPEDFLHQGKENSSSLKENSLFTYSVKASCWAGTKPPACLFQHANIPASNCSKLRH